MITPCILRSKRWASRLALCGGLLMALSVQPGAQAVQHVQVTIKDFTFITNQVPLQLSVPTLITIRNEDQVRHNFGSSVFQRSLTQVEHGGVTSYGHGIEGVFLDPGEAVAIRFTIVRPGRYEFRCSIHQDMKGELLLLSVDAV